MPQFFIDPAVGTSILSDFTRRTNTGPAPITIVDDAGTPAIFCKSWFGITSDSYDPAGQVTTAEVFLLARRSSAANNTAPGAGLRIQTNGDVYALGGKATDTLVIEKYLSGSYNGVGTAYRAYTSSTTYFYQRCRISGSLLQTRAWDVGQQEPTTWDLEVSDTTLANAGWVGLANATTNDAYYAAIGIGTNGDPAPTAPLAAPTVATPTTLGATNIQTTSARLTWSRG